MSARAASSGRLTMPGSIKDGSIMCGTAGPATSLPMNCLRLRIWQLVLEESGKRRQLAGKLQCLDLILKAKTFPPHSLSLQLRHYSVQPAFKETK